MKKNVVDRQSNFSMRLAARLTGLAPDTIRAWERRYGAVRPSRSVGRTRYYNEAEIRRLQLLKEAVAAGHAIGRIAGLSDEQIQKLTEPETNAASSLAAGGDPLADDAAFQPLLTDYLAAVQKFDVRRAGRILARAATMLRPLDLIYRVLVPALRETGDRWETAAMNVAHEHFSSMQIRGFLARLLDLAPTQPGAPRVLVAAPAGHRHEFGALIGAFLAASRGFEPIYLGPDMPFADLRAAATQSRADLVLLGVLRRTNSRETAALREELAILAETIEVWVGLPADHPLNGSLAGVRFFDSFAALDLALTQRNP